MKTTQRIAITGTDETGKTTVVRLIRDRFHDQPHVVQAFRAPQYHENPDLPFGRLSAIIDAVSECADREKNLGLKATALFLSMTLYGDVERHVAAAYAPDYMVTERQCLADSLTYAKFYLPLLQAALDQTALEPVLRAGLAPLGADALDHLITWLHVFQAREGHAPVGFWELPLYMRDLFSTPAETLIGRLQALYHADIPDRIVLLTVSQDSLTERLTEKLKGSAPRELHEHTQVLAMFQSALGQCCQLLKQVKPALIVDVLDTSEQSPAESRDAVLALVGIPG
ncbi:MAG: hypothetical protein H7338_01260 [Candidatus Sericytochromatia bacterium]|nr:hypothetical protein [Candidatus Sericytochromatia bacterium]